VNWVLENKKEAIVVGTTLALPLALLLYVLVGLWGLGHSFQQETDRLEQRIARLNGIALAGEELLAAAADAEATLRKLAYAGDDADAVSATLQKNVRGIMSGAGLVVADSRIESARREGAFDVVGLEVSVSGGIEALDEALGDIVSYTPLLLVTDISVTPARTSRRGNAGGQALSAKMNLIALVSVE
jgi:hypothetical protein